MTQLNIPCTMDPTGQVMFPSQVNPVAYAVVDTQQSEAGGSTGTLTFAGQVQAFLTFDDAGGVIGYTLAGGNDATHRSVENIVATL